MLRVLAAVLVVGAVGSAMFYVLTLPRGLTPTELAALPVGDAARGETWFWAGGCASCHAAAGAKGAEKLKLGGSLVLKTGFGDFIAPNISMDPVDGIGDWTLANFANSMLRGLSPDGRHYYPAFPYTSFTRMKPGDVADLWAYFRMLPAVPGVQPDHALSFPFSIRQGIGIWKLAFLRDTPATRLDTSDPVVARGQYLAEGAGHCGECHSRRNFAGAIDKSLWLAGAPSPTGDGRIPNITSGTGGLNDWSAADIAAYLETGFTPDYDSVGGEMVKVQENIAKLVPEDRAALAAYLKAVPPHDSAQ